MTYYGNIDDRLGAVGLDGQYRFSPASDGPDEKFLVGMRGGWSDPKTFVLDYNQVASPNAMMLTVHFDGEHVTLEGPGADGKVQYPSRVAGEFVMGDPSDIPRGFQEQ